MRLYWSTDTAASGRTAVSVSVKSQFGAPKSIVSILKSLFSHNEREKTSERSAYIYLPPYRINFFPFEVSRLHDEIQSTVIQANHVKDSPEIIVHAPEISAHPGWSSRTWCWILRQNVSFVHLHLSPQPVHSQRLTVKLHSHNYFSPNSW